MPKCVPAAQELARRAAQAKIEGRVEMIVWSLYNCRAEPGPSCAKKRFFTKAE